MENTGQFKKIYYDDPAILKMKLTKAQKLNCKLTEEQIEEVRKLYNEGNSQGFIAKKYKLSKSSIHYWVNDEYRKRANKRAIKHHRENPPTREENRLRARKYKARLKKLGFPINAKNRLKCNKWRKEYRKENPSKVNKLYLFKGKKHTLKEWSKILDIKYITLWYRINIYKWSIEKTFVKI